MTRSITIRDVPDEVVNELAARASLSGRSLQEYLKGHLVSFAQRPDPQTWAARVRARTTATGVTISREEILAHRDDARRDDARR
jgi:plasmid stability protein